MVNGKVSIKSVDIPTLFVDTGHHWWPSAGPFSPGEGEASSFQLGSCPTSAGAASGEPVAGDELLLSLLGAHNAAGSRETPSFLGLFCVGHGRETSTFPLVYVISSLRAERDESMRWVKMTHCCARTVIRHFFVVSSLPPRHKQTHVHESLLLA